MGTGPPPLQVPLSPNLLGSPAQKRSRLRPLDFYRGFITEAWLVKSLAIGEWSSPLPEVWGWGCSSNPLVLGGSLAVGPHS